MVSIQDFCRKSQLKAILPCQFPKLLAFHALIALSVADVSHLNRAYLPPYHATPEHIEYGQENAPPQQPQVQRDEVPHVQLDSVLLDESTNGNTHALRDVEQSLDNEPIAATQESATNDNGSSESSSDPFFQPGYGGFPGAGFPPGFGGPIYPIQGFPGAGFPGQGFPGQGFPGAGFPGQGFPGQGFPGQGFPGAGFLGQGFPGQGFPGAGFPGQGFPPQVGGFPGLPYQTASQQQSGGGFNTPQPVAGLNTRPQTTRIASDTVYGANGGYVYDKPK